MGFIIDDAEMMTHLLSILLEEYWNIVKNLEDKLDDDIDSLTINRIRDKLSEKYYRMSEQLGKKKSREYENPLYIKYQFKATCNKWDEYDHGSINFTERKGEKYYTYCKKD